MLPNLSIGSWLKIAGGLAAGIVVLVVWLVIKGHFDAIAADKATIEEQAGRIGTLNADVARLNNEVRKAAEDLKHAEAVYADNVAKLRQDLQTVTAARDAAIRRATKFNQLKAEIANAPDNRAASPVLVHAVDGVRGLLRGRIEDPGPSTDRVADAGRAG